MQWKERQLTLAEDWALSVVDGPVVDGKSLALTFQRGANGNPQYQIYGSNAFKNTPSDQAVGMTCRSKGGEEQASPAGLAISRTDETDRMTLEIDIDTVTTDDIFVSNSEDTGEMVTIHFCVYVALVNEATNEEFTFVELEIRYSSQRWQHFCRQLLINLDRTVL